MDKLIYVAGHRGMVGSAIVRQLKARGEKNIVVRTSNELEELISEYRNEINFIEEDQILNELMDRSLLFITKQR